MGLKLKWFRRRITFEGIPSAPERSIRRKEQNSGVTVIGVYRQSVNFEDYIEPSRASYGEPPSQPFVTTTIRKPNTSTGSSTTANKSSKKNNVGDKIARERNNGQVVETPPEPSYSPPKPPMRRGISKTKSTPNISTLESAKAEPLQLPTLEATRSVEVLNEVSVEKQENVMSVTPTPRTASDAVFVTPTPRTASDTVSVTPTPRTARINYNAEDDTEKSAKADEKDEVEQIEHWRQQQPEFFNEILEKVNGFANTSNPTTTEDDGHGSETESYEEIFQKVKAKPRVPVESPVSLKPDTNIHNYEREYSRHTSSSSVEDIFEPRPPEYIFAISMEEEPTNNSTLQPEAVQRTPEPVPRNQVEINSQPDDVFESPTKPLKSILKKRAPAPPPQQPQPTEVTTIPIEIPTPPPRAIRKQPEPTPKPPSPKVSVDDDDDDDDEYLNWNMVERHRSSITHTMAAQRVDPEIMRNVPASLQQTKPLLNTRALLDEEPPKTLRGMRNQQPAPSSDGNNILGLRSRAARDSESNLSEASA